MSTRNDIINFIKMHLEKPISEQPNFKASLWFRDYLMAAHIPYTIANRLAIETKFSIDESWTDDEIKEVIEPYAKMVANLVYEFLNNRFSNEDIFALGKSLSLEF